MNSRRTSARQGLLSRTAKVAIQLYGSLALTGHGHGTDRALLTGLEGNRPDEVDPDDVEASVQRVRSTGRLNLLGQHEISFDEPLDLLYLRNQVLPRSLERYALPLRWIAPGGSCSRKNPTPIGGGFIVRGAGAAATAFRACHGSAPSFRQRRRPVANRTRARARDFRSHAGQ